MLLDPLSSVAKPSVEVEVRDVLAEDQELLDWALHLVRHSRRPLHQVVLVDLRQRHLPRQLQLAPAWELVVQQELGPLVLEALPLLLHLVLEHLLAVSLKIHQLDEDPGDTLLIGCLEVYPQVVRRGRSS